MISWPSLLIAASLSTALPSPRVPLRGTTGEARPACHSSVTSTIAWTALGAATGALVGWAAHGRGSEATPGLYVGIGAALGGGLGFAADAACAGEKEEKRGWGDKENVHAGTPDPQLQPFSSSPTTTVAPAPSPATSGTVK